MEGAVPRALGWRRPPTIHAVGQGSLPILDELRAAVALVKIEVNKLSAVNEASFGVALDETQRLLQHAERSYPSYPPSS